jgi:hypothetical protein
MPTLKSRACMKLDLRIALLSLFMVLQATASPPPGQALASIPDFGKVCDQPAGTQQVGQDGLPGWIWPNLADGEITYGRELELPAPASLHAVLIASAGYAVPDSCHISVFQSGTLVAELAEAQLGGSSSHQSFSFEETLPQLAAGAVRIEVTRPGARAPWITADDICRLDGSSWIKLAAGQEQAINRNLNIRLLVEWAIDNQAPELLLPEDVRHSSQNPDLALRILARDAAGVQTVFALQNGDTTWLSPGGPLANGEDWEHWRAQIFLPADVSSGDELVWQLAALDSLGNLTEGDLPEFRVTLGDGFTWASHGSREDQALRQFLPALPGALVASRVPLEAARAIYQLDSLVIRGASMRFKGTGPVHVGLAMDAGGQPARSNGQISWLDEGDTLVIVEDCSGWQSLDFEIADSLMGSIGEQVWIVMSSDFPENLSGGPAPLLEWRSDSLATLDSLENTLLFDPSISEWREVAGAELNVQAMLEVWSCELDLSEGDFFADFDESFADLACMARSPERVGYGWQHSLADVSPSSCFHPDSSLGFPDSLLDPQDQQFGHYLSINSDALNAPILQDTLFLPVMSYAGPVRLSMLSLFASNFTDQPAVENARILFRASTGSPLDESWNVLVSGDSFAADVPDTTLCGDFLAGAWTERSFTVTDLPPEGRLQFAFSYFGDFAFGWALDDLRITQIIPGSPPEHWSAPQVKAAELGRVYPNPFNPSTRISYRLLESGPARLAVYNLRGQQVALLFDSQWKAAGSGEVRFSAEGLASGLYFVRLESHRGSDTQRLLYLR